MNKLAQTLSHLHCLYSSSLLLLLMLLVTVSIESSKPLQVANNPQASRSIVNQQQSNGTIDAPNYISTGRKISKILNDFFDVSHHLNIELANSFFPERSPIVIFCLFTEHEISQNH